DARVRLRPLAVTDATSYAAGAGDDAVREFGHLPESDHTPESVRAMITRDVDPGLARGDLAILTIARAGSDVFAGSLVVFDVTDGAAEVGFWIHPDHRGHGLSTAALELAATFARRSGLHTLTARTLPHNTASRRALEAAGFTAGGRDIGTAPSGQRAELVGFARSLDV